MIAEALTAEIALKALAAMAVGVAVSGLAIALWNWRAKRRAK